MATREVTKRDLWDMSTGGGALATGGGGVGPSREQFDIEVDAALSSGISPELLDPAELTDDHLVYVAAGVGGGVRREEKEIWLSSPGWGARSQPGYDQTAWINGRLDELDYLYPSCSWSERPGSGWRQTAETRLQSLIGRGADAYMPFEIGPRVYNTVLGSAAKGKPTVDADAAGHRAVPEVSLASLNVHETPIGPVTLASAWGDVLVLEKVLNWQRLEDISRHVAVSCGGGVSGMMSFSGSHIRTGAVTGTISKAIRVGRAIREATDAGNDPIAAAATAAGGYVLFRGRVLAQLNEDKGSFIWGDERIEGTGEFAGHSFRIWYKNENHMSWFDGDPYVMSPDAVTVLDAETGHGLSNFAHNDWTWGREVGVIGVPCPPVWRTARGLRIFHPRRWGFACDYRPMEEVIGAAS